MSLEIVPATADDVPALAAHLTDVAIWKFAQEGYANWPIPFPEAMVSRMATQETLYLARLDGSLAASLVLQWDDPHIWGEQPPVAGYIHKFAVHPDFKGRSLGSTLLAWTDVQIADRGRQLLRL